MCTYTVQRAKFRKKKQKSVQQAFFLHRHVGLKYNYYQRFQYVIKRDIRGSLNKQSFLRLHLN